VGIICATIFINFADVYSMKNYQHPDDSYRMKIFEKIPMSNISIINENQAETYFLIFWIYGIIFKYFLVISGLIVFCFIFVCKGFYRLLHHGEI